MVKALITGATGFLGLPTVVAFLEAGHEVVALGRRPRAEDSLPPEVEYHQHNFLEQNLEPSFFERHAIDTLVHLAWDVSPGSYWQSLGNLSWASASLALLHASLSAQLPRVVCAGTCAEYDWSFSTLAPSTPLNPSTLYGRAKASLHEISSKAAFSTITSLAWGRVFFPYGPREHPGRLVPSVINALLDGEHAKCSEGFQERDFVYVDDLARAFLLLAESQEAGAFNLASGTCVSIREAVSVIVEIIGGEVNFGALPTRPGDPKRLAADICSLQKLGFRQATPLRAGLERSVQWWARQRREVQK